MTHDETTNQFFIPGVSSFPPGAHYNWMQGEPLRVRPLDDGEILYIHQELIHNLTLFIPNPTRKEIRSIRCGTMRFGVYTPPTSIYAPVFLCFKAGSMPWSDSPYVWHMVPEELRPAPHPNTIEPGKSDFILLRMVDSTTGRVVASRLTTIGHATTKALHEAVLKQSRMEYDPAEEQRVQAQVYATTSSNEMASRAVGLSKVKSGNR